MVKRGPKPKFSADEVARIAYELAVHERVEAVSLAQIAQAVGTSPSALYRYFPNKEALLRAMRPFAIRDAVQVLDAPITMTESVDRDLRVRAMREVWAITDRWLAFMDREPICYRLAVAVLYDSAGGTR